MVLRETDYLKLKILGNRPFDKLSNIKEVEMNQDEISSIQSITVEEIHAGLFDYIKEAFSHQLNTLFKDAGGKLRTAILTRLGLEFPKGMVLDYTFPGFISLMVCNWLHTLIREYGRKFNYKLITFGARAYPNIEMLWSDMQLANSLLIRNHIHISNIRMPPSIIPRNKIEDWEVPSMSLFENSKPTYLITIGNILHHITTDQSNYLLIYCNYRLFI